MKQAHYTSNIRVRTSSTSVMPQEGKVVIPTHWIANDLIGFHEHISLQRNKPAKVRILCVVGTWHAPVKVGRYTRRRRWLRDIAVIHASIIVNIHR